MLSYSLKINQHWLPVPILVSVKHCYWTWRSRRQCVVNYVVDPASAEAVADKIRSFGSKAITLKADVSNEEEVKSMYKAMFKEFGTIDILVNNAGLQRDAAFHNMTLDNGIK
jgi:Dehydrogenases with different specificities (related to short-chain alcohol dehydrogenases)